MKYYHFFIFVKMRHNNIEYIERIEKGGGLLYHWNINTGLGEKMKFQMYRLLSFLGVIDHNESVKK